MRKFIPPPQRPFAFPAFGTPGPCAGDYDESHVMRAWEDFLAGSHPGGLGQPQPTPPVRGVIQDSWQRCAVGGVDCQAAEAPMDDDKATIAQLRHINDELLLAARQSFAAMGPLLDGAGAMLVLADAQGVLIDVIGDRQTIHDGMDIHLGVGGRWTEDVAGTNGIGTALWADRPVFVHAAEHFCAGIKSWTCAGAPIHDPFDNAVIGVIDLSGHPDIFRPHNTALVASCAREIEERIAEQQNRARVRLLEAFIGSTSSYRHPDGLMILDRQGRPIYVRNMRPEVLGAIMPDGGTPPMRRMARRPDIDLMADIEQRLPPSIGQCHINALRLGAELEGVAIVLPAGRGIATPAVSRTPQSGPAPVREIIGESDAIREAVELACLVAESPGVSSLLVEGETGTGKELIARLIHARGRTSTDAPFVALNCGAITRELFGSELFGHAAGAFTGATREGKPGVLERANGGLLSLDEIGEMPLDMQPFLLRALEERIVRRIGDSRERPLNLRVVASTNRDLRQEAAEGRFRWDLYYRISAIRIPVPPLRARGDDILLLAEHFSRRQAATLGTAPLYFTEEARRALLAYGWPGNVRELRNLIERLHLLCRDGLVAADHLPPEITAPGARAPLPAPTAADSPERRALRAALDTAGGNLSHAAQLLGISRPTLYRRLEQHGIRRGFTGG